jgi:glycosyltransferase involved in cell wall biosynthesis
MRESEDGVTARALSYACVTPARDEATRLPRLAKSLAAQTVRPHAWVIVENGSEDATADVAADLARRHAWIRLLRRSEPAEDVRGGAIVRAFAAGVEALGGPVDVVVNLDADVSLDPDYFERLLARFEADPTLGIASGSAYELVDGEWVQRFATRGTVWGATRAYRRACLEAVSPLEERLGWDGLDELAATARGWQTATFLDLPFRHHRPVGARDRTPFASWSAEGRLAHYMHYRLSYLAARAGFQAVRHRRPAALGLLWGYTGALVRREPRWKDAEAAALLRRLQRARALPIRAREAFGRRA